VPIYDYRCAAGHYYEASAAMTDDIAPSCPCGAGGLKVPSRVSLGGVAEVGRPMELMPQTWRGTHDGNREYVGRLRREWDTRQRLEDKHPELQGDRRPILAHEGRFERAPLRVGDPIPPAPAPHSHPHPHPHPHPS
jgi:putative FmdB family regulatory protein